MQYTVIPANGIFQVYNTVRKTIHTAYNNEAQANSVCAGLNRVTRFEVIKSDSNSTIVVWDTQQGKCHSNGYADKQTAEAVCAILNGRLTVLEAELLAHVRSMSAKLLEAADQWQMYVKNFPEPAADYRACAKYESYMQQFPVMEQFGYK